MNPHLTNTYIDSGGTMSTVYQDDGKVRTSVTFRTDDAWLFMNRTKHGHMQAHGMELTPEMAVHLGRFLLEWGMNS